MDTQIPKRLYKYRQFDARALDALVSDELYFASPSTFNDPLDVQPTLFVDVDVEALKRILWALVVRRTTAEMETSAKKLKVQIATAAKDMERASRNEASRLIGEIEYNSTDPDVDAQYLVRSLALAIEKELVRRYDRGIVCLSTRCDCPALWSHYGDQHQGICVGYSVPEKATDVPAKVMYGGSKLVPASKVSAMLSGDVKAGREVDHAVLFRKGKSWKYEREWRLVGRQGLQWSQLELEEIIFGLRFSEETKHAVAKVFEGRERAVEFYEMRQVSGKFKLEKCRLDYSDNTFTDFPRRRLSVFEEFSDLTVKDSE